jgi:rhodanese-related sulfurtransferase
MKSLLSLMLTIAFFCNPAQANELQNVTPEQLLDMQQNQHALVVDIRTPAEWQASGVIANSQKLQSFDAQGKFDQDKWLAELEKLKSSLDQPVILVCRSGNRSGNVGTLLSDKIGMKNVYHLQNGLQSWIKSGNPVSPDCPSTTCK